MAIHILAGPLGANSPLVKFVGPNVREVLYYTTQITAEIDPADGDRLYVIDDARTTIEGSTYYAVTSAPYTEWVGELSETFTSALEAVTYINNLTFSKSTSIARRFTDITAHAGQLHQVDVNTPFILDCTVDGAITYFWRGQDFPAGVELDAHNNRVISGILTQTGIHDFQLEVGNVLGISTATVSIEVI